MKGLTTVKSWARELIDLLLVFIVLGVLVQIIFGASGGLVDGIPYFGEVVKNLIDLVNQLGQAGIVGLIALLVIVGLYSGGRTTS